MDTIRQDLVYALRAMRRNPVATAVIVLTLAIGIGANTAIFSLVNAVLVRPLPYHDPERLVAVWLEFDNAPGQKAFATYGDFLKLRDEGGSFEAIAGNTWANAGRTLMWRGEPHRAVAVPATADLFATLGVRAALGRTFVADDSANGCTAVLADRFWRNRLGGESEIVGGSITLDGELCAVVGVMPADFEFFPKQTEVWTLITPTSAFARNPISGLAIFGRLKPGVTRAAAEEEALSLHRRLIEETPPESGVRGSTLAVYDLQGEFTFLAGAKLRQALLMLSAAVAMILLICCANVAGILLSRAAERRKELALRAALGSGRRRIVRQLLTESTVLAAAGACLGAILAAATVAYFRAVNPIDLPAASEVGVDWQVLAFTAAAGLLAALLFGVAPAITASRVDLNAVLKSSSAGVARDWLGRRGGQALVVGEVSLSMVLLVAAGLLIQSIYRLASTPLTFRTDRLMMARVTLPAEDYDESADRSQFYDSLLARVAALPGIEDVALASNTPLNGQNGNAVTVAGGPAATSDFGNVGVETVSANYTAAMSVPLLRGRELDSRDREENEPVALVNQRFVDEYLAGQEPIGARIKIGLEAGPNPWLTIVGVAGNVERSDFFNEMSFRVVPIVYRPVQQQPPRSLMLLIRTRTDLTDLGAMVRREVAALDARVPLHDLGTMDDVLRLTFAQPRFRTLLLGGFAGIALLLAAIGIYGLLTRAVVTRTREIGIRVALGADGRRVLRSVMREGLALAGIGIVAGIAASAYLTRFLATMLYGVGTIDPLTIAATAGVLAAAALVATYIPARRATRVDPLVALRDE
jgi:predicted permease